MTPLGSPLLPPGSQIIFVLAMKWRGRSVSRPGHEEVVSHVLLAKLHLKNMSTVQKPTRSGLPKKPILQKVHRLMSYLSISVLITWLASYVLGWCHKARQAEGGPRYGRYTPLLLETPCRRTPWYTVHGKWYTNNRNNKNHNDNDKINNNNNNGDHDIMSVQYLLLSFL